MKKAEARKVRKVVKPLGDDDLFGDSGDIFSDIPSKPKGTKKKKSATTVPGDDIFAKDATVAGLSFYFWFVSFVIALLMSCATEQTVVLFFYLIFTAII